MAHTDPFNVLIVDDDALARDLLTRHLHAAGYAVAHAVDAPAALDLLDAAAPAGRPRVLIVDWEMPGADGTQLCRMIRDREAEFGFVYVIMLTVHTDKARLIEAFDAGVDDFLSKPFDGGELLARLRAGRRVLALESELSARVRDAERLTAQLAALNVQLETLAGTDALTGLPNRRRAMARLDEMLAHARRYGRPLACAMVDVDDFKRLNDTHGHATGDAALKVVARTLREALRGSDVVARIGGEEFLILLPDQTTADAAVVAERCRAAVATAAVLPQHPAHHLTISVGVATLDPAAPDVTALLQAVDQALYDAKRSGKNRVVRLDSRAA
jgi:diguanylate cyclase (GGDEF)-like protein